MDRGAWRATVRRVTKSQTRLKGQSTHAGDACGDVLMSRLSISLFENLLPLNGVFLIFL